MDNKPLVSVLMTAYNREKYIAEAIESVLASTYQNWELIIVDDCSKDNSFSISQTFADKDKRIKLYQNEKNLGQFANRNKAAEYATGKYIKYLDSDDLIYPCSLQIMVKAMEENPEAGIGLSYNSYNNETSLPIMFSIEEVLITHFFRKGLLYNGPSGCIYNRDYFNKIGGFGHFGVASDYDFNLKAACYRPIVLFQRDLIWWRVHPNQEFKLKEDDYMRENYQILHSLIRNENFPLVLSKKKEILINYKKNNARKAIFAFLSLKIIKAMKIIKITKPGLSGFFFALLPSKLRKFII